MAKIYAPLVFIVGALALVGCTPAEIHHRSANKAPATSATATQPTTVDIQGSGEWKRSPHMHAYYDMTAATFRSGTNVDVDAYEQKSFDIFRQFARANGLDETGMLDHLKLIPRQVVGIVKENPAVLKDYDSFWAALAGPE